MNDDTVVIDGETFSVAGVAANPRALLSLYADRCSDLSYEYDARMAAEKRADFLYEIMLAYANHRTGCAIDSARDPGAPLPLCNCGFDEALTALDALPGPPLANTPLGRLVALGRAALAYYAATNTGDVRGAHAAYRVYQAALLGAQRQP